MANTINMLAVVRQVSITALEDAVEQIDGFLSHLESKSLQDSLKSSNSSSNFDTTIQIMETLLEKVDLGSFSSYTINKENFRIRVENINFESNGEKPTLLLVFSFIQNAGSFTFKTNLVM